MGGTPPVNARPCAQRKKSKLMRRPEFLVRYPKVNVVAHATDQFVDIVDENFDVAIRARSEPLPNSTLEQRTLTAPWFVSLPDAGNFNAEIYRTFLQ